MLSSNSNEVKTSFCDEKVIKGCFSKVILTTMNDPSPITLSIVKRFIKLMQLVTQAPHTY